MEGHDLAGEPGLPGHAEVFAIGDMVLVMEEDGRPVPGVSPAAMQMGKHVARLIGDEDAACRASVIHRAGELERMLDLALASDDPADSPLARTAGSF